jgi:hypothetical protein
MEPLIVRALRGEMIRILVLTSSDEHHVATNTWPNTADTLCGLKRVRVLGFMTEGHPDLPPYSRLCAECARAR